MRQLYETWDRKKLWFDFDNPLDTLLFENIDYQAVYEQLKSRTGAGAGERFLVCIDEIQNYPEITRLIKFMIDHYGVKFIVTGSSNYYLRNLFPESLSGRKFLFVLPALSYKEYLYFNDLADEAYMLSGIETALHPRTGAEVYRYRELYDDYLEFGGFPEVAVANQLSRYGKLSFYNKRNSAEIDFVLDGESAFEVKQTATPADARKLDKIADSLNLKNRYLISKTPVNGEMRAVYPWTL